MAVLAVVFLGRVVARTLEGLFRGFGLRGRAFRWHLEVLFVTGLRKGRAVIRVSRQLYTFAVGVVGLRESRLGVEASAVREASGKAVVPWRDCISHGDSKAAQKGGVGGAVDRGVPDDGFRKVHGRAMSDRSSIVVLVLL